MKKVINVGIGGRSFVIDEDAYQRLDAYIERFKEKVQMGLQTQAVYRVPWSQTGGGEYLYCE
mgnify:CR=1 FL=1